MLDNRMLKWGAVGLVAMAIGIGGCAARSDLDAVSQNEQSMREMIANDQQQMTAMHEQIAQLNDRITELQHNGADSDSKQTAALKDRIAKLESQVNATAAGTPLAPGAPGVTGAPGVPGVPGGPGGAPGAPVMPGTPGAAPGIAPGAESASVAPGETGAPAEGEGEAATPEPAVTGWQSALDQELANASNSSEPGSRIYRDGLVDMKAAKYPNAVGKFQAFQRAHPKSPLVEPAEYFSANALFEMVSRDPSNYNQAILQFNDLAMRFPKGRFAASAQLREAQAFLRTNDSLDARLTLQKLMRDHPGTPEASAADAMMKSMASN
jgi:TolA-binding protein